MEIPMPGHPVSSVEEEALVRKNCKDLQDLVASHDAVFLLTDTRESRWLPTLLCANENKVNYVYIFLVIYTLETLYGNLSFFCRLLLLQL
jgi:hypothetical protein